MTRRQKFPRGEHDPWFRVGTLDVSTTVFVTGVSVFTFILYAFSPNFLLSLVLFPDAVRSLQLWRVVTWPFANVDASLWTVITIFFFWYFGARIEEQLGRAKMARFLVMLTLGFGLLAVLISAPFGSFQPILYGLGQIELVILLLFIAENPHMRFFFNIPGWVIAAILVALPIIQMLGNRQGLLLLNLLLGLGLAALMARSMGMLAEYSFVPKIGGASGGGARPRRQRRKRSGKSGGGGVVAGPWAGSSAPPNSDRARLDALLDKISEGGMDSLSKSEKEQLQTLRRRIRGE